MGSGGATPAWDPLRHWAGGKRQLRVWNLVLGRGGPQRALWCWGCETGLGAHLEAGLGTKRAHQPMQGVEPQLDIEAPLLLCRDVCDAPVLSLVGQKVG